MKLTLLSLSLILTQILSAQTFTEVLDVPFADVDQSSIAFSDVDGDGDQDVLITGLMNGSVQSSTLYLNDGAGRFRTVGDTTFEPLAAASIAFADVDGDDDQDVILTGSGLSGSISKLYTNDGTGTFFEKTGTPFEGVSSGSIAFSDVDGDDDQDVLITGSNAGLDKISKLYTNDGFGNFIEKVDTPFDGVSIGSIAFSDVDGDNDQDVLITGFTRNGGISKLYTNDGSGNFQEKTGTSFVGVGAGSIAFSDVDGDMDQDVFISGLSRAGGLSFEVSKLYTNDGSGNFSVVADVPFDDVVYSTITFQDIDSDNDTDIFIAGKNSSDVKISKLYTNDGSGKYTLLVGTPFEGVTSSSVAFADVDGDNDQDVLITGENSLGSKVSKLYLNDGVSSTKGLSTLEFDLSVYPNPTRATQLNLSYDSPDNGFVALEVYDLKGAVLSEQNVFATTGQQTFTIDISSLVPGTYMVQLNNGKGIGSRKFVVE